MTFTEAQLSALIASVFWPMVRIGALFVAMPVFGNKQLSVKVKVLLSLMIALIVAPTLEVPPVIDVFSGEALMIMFQQVVIGLVMGFSLHMVLGSLGIAPWPTPSFNSSPATAAERRWPFINTLPWMGNSKRSINRL